MSRRTKHSGVSRRDLLRYGIATAALTPFVSPLGRVFADESAAVKLPGKGKAKQVVLLYMSGGASHFETFDPKPGASTGGPTKAISTNVSGIHIADSLPLLAKRMDKICLVRGMTSREGNHERARYLLHTGYPPTPTVVHAGLGSILSHELGDPFADLPNYISVNGPGARPGYLGVNHAPFAIQVRSTGAAARDGRRDRRMRPGGGATVQNLNAPKRVDSKRRDRRLDFLDKLNKRFGKDHADDVPQAQGAMFERATRLMDSPKNTAFDLSTESAKTREAYGQTGFGQGCLMARRLIDEGVTCVEVTSGGWDTHDDNFNRVRNLNGELDRGASALLDDLAKSGKLDETLVIWVGDFGRTPNITASQGRGHYPRAWSMWMAGGPVQGGRVIGKTDARGAEVVENPVTPNDLFASIAHATGFDRDKLFHSNGRPITLVYEDGKEVGDFFNA